MFADIDDNLSILTMPPGMMSHLTAFDDSIPDFSVKDILAATSTQLPDKYTDYRVVRLSEHREKHTEFVYKLNPCESLSEERTRVCWKLHEALRGISFLHSKGFKVLLVCQHRLLSPLVAALYQVTAGLSRLNYTPTDSAMIIARAEMYFMDAAECKFYNWLLDLMDSPADYQLYLSKLSDDGYVTFHSTRNPIMNKKCFSMPSHARIVREFGQVLTSVEYAEFLRPIRAQRAEVDYSTVI